MLGGGIADEQKKQDITEDNDDQEADPQANPNQEEQDDVEVYPILRTLDCLGES